MLELIAMGCLNQPEWKHEVITTKSNYILFICDVLLLPIFPILVHVKESLRMKLRDNYISVPSLQAREIVEHLLFLFLKMRYTSVLYYYIASNV